LIIIGHKDGSIEKASNTRFTQQIKGYNAHTIIGGEFAVGKDNEEIAFKTLLGSCVAIMFYDKVQKVKGMNHFLLPTTKNSNEDMKYVQIGMQKREYECQNFRWCRYYATQYVSHCFNWT
jgi:chemotaxis protein CheD